MAGANADVIWWEGGDGDSEIDWRKLLQLTQAVDFQHGTRRAMNLHHLRLYTDRDLFGATGGSWHRAPTLVARVRELAGQRKRPKLSINVVRNMVNSATSMICRSRPRPQFLTTGGDWDMQRKAKRRTQFNDAVFNAENTYQLGTKAVQHANILGTGAVKIVRDYTTKRIRHETAYIGEILVDEAEGVYGTPRNYFQIRPIDRIELKRLYGHIRGAEESIDKAQPAAKAATLGETTDQVIVVEAWHLASGKDTGDGRSAVITDGGELFSEEYKWQAPPFAFDRWEEDPLGFYGTGIPSELCGIQYEINETIRNIQANWWAGGNLKVLVNRGSKIVRAHLNNDIRGTVVEYTGQPPSWMTTEAVAPGLVRYLEMLIQHSYEVTGISQLNAQSTAPDPNMSGRAKLVHDNNESLRFLPAQRRHEQFYIDIARRTMEAASDIYEREGDFEVVFAGKEYLDPIKYSEIAAADDAYDVQCYPTSVLPSTPAGKLDFVEALEARGYIDATEAKRLLDFPDLKRELDFDLAQVDLIDERLTKILNGEQYIAPFPDMDLQMCLKRSLNAIALAENRGVPEERISKLRQWRDTAQKYLDDAAPPPAPPAPMGPPTGPGLPGAAPPQFPDQLAPAPQNPINEAAAA